MARETTRLKILQSLLESQGYTASQEDLLQKLHEIGTVLSRDQLRLELAWLSNMDALIVRDVRGVWIITLTDSGAEHLEGSALIPGVQPQKPSQIRSIV